MTVSLNKLPKTKTRRKKRVGRGYGSGKGGHTAGRGAKGAKARGKAGLLFEGTKRKKSLVRRLPFQRGKGKLKPLKNKPVVINLDVLNLLPKGKVVDVKTLVKNHLVDGQQAVKSGVKILGGGKLRLPLKVALPCSQSAAVKIKKAGGEVLRK